MSGAWRHDLIPVLSLTGVVLDALGGLYLAYDLLGGKKGPLRTITKSVSYGVMFGIIYGLPLGLWFGLAGLLVPGRLAAQPRGMPLPQPRVARVFPAQPTGPTSTAATPSGFLVASAKWQA